MQAMSSENSLTSPGRTPISQAEAAGSPCHTSNALKTGSAPASPAPHRPGTGSAPASGRPLLLLDVYNARPFGRRLQVSL